MNYAPNMYVLLSFYHSVFLVGKCMYNNTPPLFFLPKSMYFSNRFMRCFLGIMATLKTQSLGSVTITNCQMVELLMMRDKDANLCVDRISCDRLTIPRTEQTRRENPWPTCRTGGIGGEILGRETCSGATLKSRNTRQASMTLSMMILQNID